MPRGAQSAKIRAMMLQSVARDCLYLNWAVPLDWAPPLPLPMRYEIHRGADKESLVFVTALLYRVSGLHLSALPLPRVGYPQMSVRLYVLDGSDVPSILFLRVLVPSWVVPASRLFGRQAATAARLDFPGTPLVPHDEGWSWRVEQEGKRLEVAARPAAPFVGAGPRLGTWEQTVDYFRHRRNAYALHQKRLRSINTSRTTTALWPLAVEVGTAELVAASLPGAAGQPWPELHSAWLCPEIPFHFEIGRPLEVRLARQGVPVVAEGC